jgi:hypothetical protein
MPAIYTLNDSNSNNRRELIYKYIEKSRDYNLPSGGIRRHLHGRPDPRTRPIPYLAATAFTAPLPRLNRLLLKDGQR